MNVDVNNVPAVRAETRSALCDDIAARTTSHQEPYSLYWNRHHRGGGCCVEVTWANRDFPVLEAIVRLLDQSDFSITVRDAARDTGLDPIVVDRAVTAL